MTTWKSYMAFGKCTPSISFSFFHTGVGLKQLRTMATVTGPVSIKFILRWPPTLVLNSNNRKLYETANIEYNEIEGRGVNV